MARIFFLTGEYRQFAQRLMKESSPRAAQIAIRAGVTEGAIIYEKTLRGVLQSRRELHTSKNKPRLKTRVRRRVLSQRRYAPNVYFEVGTYSPAREDPKQVPAAVRLRFLEGTVDRWTGGRNDSKAFTPGAGQFRGRVKAEGLIAKTEQMAGARAFMAMEQYSLLHFQNIFR